MKFEIVFFRVSICGHQLKLTELLEDGLFDLYYTSKKFTLLTFATSVSNADIVQMKTLAHQMISQCQQNTDDEVWCKLHHLSHYWALLERFGPLGLYATWHNEAKHQDAKFYARRTNNFVNLSHTISCKQQLNRAEALKQQDYFNLVFDYSQPDARFPIITNYEEMRKKFKWCDKVQLAKDRRPFKPNYNLLYRIPGKRDEWLQVLSFYSGGPDGSVIFASGHKYGFKATEENRLIGGSLQPITITNKEILIDVSHLRQYEKDFIFNFHDDPFCIYRSNCKDLDCYVRESYIVPWIH